MLEDIVHGRPSGFLRGDAAPWMDRIYPAYILTRGTRAVGCRYVENGTCFGRYTRGDVAAAACFAIGARLCTAAEVHAGEALGTGCGYNTEHVWTSSACAVAATGEHGWLAAMVDATVCAVPSQQTPHPVRCCADVHPRAIDNVAASVDDAAGANGGRAGVSSIGVVVVVASAVLVLVAVVVILRSYLIKRRAAQEDAPSKKRSGAKSKILLASFEFQKENPLYGDPRTRPVLSLPASRERVQAYTVMRCVQV